MMICVHNCSKQMACIALSGSFLQLIDPTVSSRRQKKREHTCSSHWFITIGHKSALFLSTKKPNNIAVSVASPDAKFRLRDSPPWPVHGL
jgi:hypothetical protein